MGFWDVIDRVVGCIPIIGTVKDTIEAGIEEAQGHHAEAKEKLLEAGLGIASDIVTVATFGAGAEVAIAGKMAAEEVLKQAAKGALKTAAEEASLGLGKNAAIVVTAAAAARAARAEASRRNTRKPFKPPSPVPKRPPKEPKEPKRGHHVINNGVIRIFHDIIERFFEEHRARIFFGNSYQDLVAEGIINPDETPILMRSHDQPLPRDVSAQIETMVAYTPRGETHTDTNDVIFGASKVGLTNAVRHIVFHVFTSLEETGRMPDLRGGFLHQMQSMIGVIAFITEEPTGQNGIYVDNQALRWWLAGGGQMAQFIRCRDNVRDMFNSLADVRRPPYERIACIWGREIFHVYRRLIERHNLTPRLLSITHNPVAFVESPEQPPDHAIKLGYQNDGVGEIYSAVAKTRWGTIPGKAKGKTCWFPYGGKEYTTENFVWLTSMRPVKMKRNEGHPPKVAIQCAFQEDGAGYLYAAIAETKWGEIPGKAKDSTCWYPYGGREYYTSDFYWLVRGTPE